MTELSTQPYKGTRDFYPEDMYIRQHIFDMWSRVMRRYGYEAYDAPLLEPIEVYAAKSGQELVNDQTYRFIDRGGREVAIRPEMTPSISRMVAARRKEMPFPARLYSIAPFMRYERPQRGREREFWQLNADIFGDDSNMAELEILSLSRDIMEGFGATPDMYEIRINHRGLIDAMMRDYLALNDEQAYAMVKLFDRKDKLSREDFSVQLGEIAGERAEEIAPKVDRILDAKTLDALPDEIRRSPHFQSLNELISKSTAIGVKSLRFDPTLMRGLDYYTGTVFEVFDLHPDNNRALFGGGRYDGLVGLFGAEPLSAVGFAPGYSMMELFLRVHNLLPESHSTTDLMLIAMSGYEVGAADFARKLRMDPNWLNVELDTTGRKIEKALKAADRKGIRFTAVYGERESNGGHLQLKDLVAGKNFDVTIDDIRTIITQLSK